jgi:hypothetical protein
MRRFVWTPLSFWEVHTILRHELTRSVMLLSVPLFLGYWVMFSSPFLGIRHNSLTSLYLKYKCFVPTVYCKLSLIFWRSYAAMFEFISIFCSTISWTRRVIVVLSALRIRDPVPFWSLDPDPGRTSRIIFPRAWKNFLG